MGTSRSTNGAAPVQVTSTGYDLSSGSCVARTTITTVPRYTYVNLFPNGPNAQVDQAGILQ